MISVLSYHTICNEATDSSLSTHFWTNPTSVLSLTCTEAILGAHCAVSRAATAFSVCGIIPFQTLRSAGVVLQQVLLLAAETVRGTPLTGRTLGGTRLTYFTFSKPSGSSKKSALTYNDAAPPPPSRNEMKRSVAPPTRLHTRAVVQVEAFTTVLTLLVGLTHDAALGTLCTAAGRLIGKGGRGTASCAGLLGSQEKT